MAKNGSGRNGTPPLLGGFGPKRGVFGPLGPKGPLFGPRGGVFAPPGPLRGPPFGSILGQILPIELASPLLFGTNF